MEIVFPQTAAALITATKAIKEPFCQVATPTLQGTRTLKDELRHQPHYVTIQKEEAETNGRQRGGPGIPDGPPRC